MNLCDLLRRAADVRHAEGERDNYKASWLTALTRLDLANQREEALQAALAAEREKTADLAFQLKCMSVDNADLERVNEALRGGLQFFDPSQGAT